MVKLLGSCIISATSSKNWVLVLVKQRWMYTVIIVAVELCIVQLVVNSHGTHTLGGTLGQGTSVYSCDTVPVN